MSITVFIDGAAGTTGLEIRERLSGRKEIELLLLDEQLRKNSVKRREALNSADFVILCLPDDAAREAVEMIAGETTRVIDASTAHRVADGWTYGFAELEPGQSAAIAAAGRVSNPGCFPIGFLALVRPLIRAGLIPVDFPLSVSAASGYSGGGRAMIAEFEDDKARGFTTTAFRNYALGLDVGTQTWFTFGGTFLETRGAFASFVNWPLFGLVIDRWVVNYGLLWTKPKVTHLLRAGIGLSF